MHENSRRWVSSSFSWYCSFKSFQMLKRLQELNNSDLFWFLHVRHHLNSSLFNGQRAFDSSLLELFMNEYRSDSMPKVISLYLLFLFPVIYNLYIYIKSQKCNRENNKLSPRRYLAKKNCEFQCKISNSNSWKSFDWEVSHSVFRDTSSVQLQAGSSSCWRLYH